MRADGVSVTVGIILAGVVSASAADLKAVPILKAPPAPVSYNWTGCHVGVQGGVAWGTSKHTQDDFRANGFGLALTDDFTVSGSEIGGTVGCDYQINNWVIGVENDISWTNKKGSAHLIPPFLPAANTFETNENWLDTQRARLGFSPPVGSHRNGLTLAVFETKDALHVHADVIRFAERNLHAAD